MNEQEIFLQALANNEDDVTTRLVYADWLDERGEHEEADRQRKWPAAKEWLVQLCQEHFHPEEEDNSDVPEEDDSYGYFGISYQKLVALGRRAVAQSSGGQLQFYCGANEGMMEVLETSSGEFWTNWSIVTGITLPPEVIEESVYHCGC